MIYTYGQIIIKKNELFLEELIYKYLEDSLLRNPKKDKHKNGDVVYIYTITNDQESYFKDLIVQIAHWRIERRSIEIDIIKEVEEILNDNFPR